jgi:hypothetical protein
MIEDYVIAFPGFKLKSGPNHDVKKTLCFSPNFMGPRSIQQLLLLLKTKLMNE